MYLNLDQLKLRKMRWIDVGPKHPEFTQPRRCSAIAIEPAVHNFLGVGIDRAKNTRGNLVRQSRRRLAAYPKTAQARRVQRERTEILTRYSYAFHFAHHPGMGFEGLLDIVSQSSTNVMRFSRTYLRNDSSCFSTSSHGKRRRASRIAR